MARTKGSMETPVTCENSPCVASMVRKKDSGKTSLGRMEGRMVDLNNRDGRDKDLVAHCG